MDRRALGPAAPMRTFAALATLLAAGLTLPASQPRPAPARPVPAWHGTGRAPDTARAGRHLQAVRAAPVTRASVSVSFDGGKTWHQARVSGHGGSYAAVFTAPAGAPVTLRTSAADAAGGTVTETITSAYRTGR
jgi:hypothetical protein